MQGNCKKLIKWNILLDDLEKKNVTLQLWDKEKAINKTRGDDADFCVVGSRKVFEKTQVVSFPEEMIQ